MNNDLISRSVLLNKTRTIKPPECNSCEYEYMRYVHVEDVWNAPGVDAETVRHGRWIDMQEDDATEGMWRCSACGFDGYFDIMTPEEWGTNYCPNCGAKMDAEVEG